MTAPREVRIGTVTIHAHSVREARALADALPAALEQALRESSALDRMVPRGIIDGGIIDAGTIVSPAKARTLPARVAERIVAAATGTGIDP